MRTIRWIAVFTCIACLAFCSRALAVPSSELPPVVVSAALSQEYAKVQADLGISESDRVRNVVDTLAIASLESLKSHAVIDIRFLYSDPGASGIGSCGYEMGRASLDVVNEVYYGLQVESYAYHPDYRSVSIDGTRATVVMTPVSELVYNGYSGGNPSAVHTFALVKRAGQWRIETNLYSDDMTEQFPGETDWAKIVKGFRRAQDDYKTKCEQWLRDTKGDFQANPRQEGASSIQPMSGVYLYKNPTHQSLLVQYARTYTDNSGTTNRDTYNPLFRDDPDVDGKDCMNYASQCIWILFGGINTQQAVEGRWSPMVYNVQGANNWWSVHATSTDTWTSISYFKDMLFDNWTWDKIGVQGTVGIYTGVTVGDLVDHRSIGHVYVVTGWYDGANGCPANGTVDWGELQMCAHTNNREDFWLHRTIQLSDAKFTYIQRYKLSN